MVDIVTEVIETQCLEGSESTATSFIKRSNDSKLLDINNTVDMEDYFFDRSATKMEKGSFSRYVRTTQKT